MNEDRCPWSDLHPWECWHCRLEPVTPLAPVVTSEDYTLAGERVALTIVARPHRDLPRTGRALPEKLEDYRLHDYVAALCDWTINAEPHDVVNHHPNGSITTYTTRHTTTSPPLILQLWQAAGKSRGMDSGSRAFRSQPSAAIEALDVANDIDREVHRILRHDHGIVNSHDAYPETIKAVRHLGSIATDTDARTVKRWWSTARVVTGWDLSAFKPDNTCPICGRRGSLRIKYPTAFCVECRAHWDEETLGHLAVHIRAENHEDDETESEAG